MGMAASSLRFAQLTARKNQVEFEGQQINQQRLTLSQKSSAIYNDMLTKQVPTAPDPSAFTKIVYKFNNGFGTSSILNLARKTSGAYNYNVTYKRPKTTQTLSKSSFSNVGFTSHIGVTTTKDKNVESYYARTANINGVARNLSLVGGNSAAGKLAAYRSKLETYKNMKTIEEQISSLSSKKATDTVSTSTQQNIKSALGLDLNDGQDRTAIEKALFGKEGKASLAVLPTNDLSGTNRHATDPTKQAAYDIAHLLGVATPATQKSFATEFTKATLYDVFNGIMTSEAQNNLKVMFGAKDSEDNWTLDEKFGKTGTGSDDKLSAADVKALFSDFNELQMADLQNYLVGEAGGTGYTPATAQNYGNAQAANSLYNIASGNQADETITNEQMINMLKELLKETSEADGKAAYNSSGEYKKGEVDPAFTQYQASVATPGIQNISEGQMLYTYQDDNGETCYMYVSIDNILDDGSSTYADSVSIYENVLNYLDGEYETEQQDANVIMSEDGQVAKITFADGTVVTPEIVTEMDNDAYDQAMVEYEYKKEVYDKEMNDANAKVKIIQAQDQKLEVRLKQLDTEQKALQTEIDAVKSIRDKSIESSFKTFS